MLQQQRFSALAVSVPALLILALSIPPPVAAHPAAGGAAVMQAATAADAPGPVAPCVRILESLPGGLRMELSLPPQSPRRVSVGDETYDLLEIPGGGFQGQPGEPMLPTYSRLLAIPDSAGVTIEVVAVEADTLTDCRIAPAPEENDAPAAADPTAYGRSGFGDAPWALAGAPAVARGVRVVALTFQPVRFDPASNRAVVARRLEIIAGFAGTDPRNARPGPAPQGPARPRGESFDRLLSELVVNHALDLRAGGERGSAPRNERGSSAGSYVLICPNSPAVLAALQPLVEWRTRRGFEVRVATTAETGATAQAIKNWIQNAYDTWDAPPEYITLVGDAGGDIAIPCWYENLSGYNGEGDNPYVLLDGDDFLADAHIGRISVSTIAELQLYVLKIVSYERTPYLADTEWYTRGCVVGDPSISGYTCVQVMQWLKERLLYEGYTEVDTVFSAPWISQMRAKLNRGDTVFGYRGYYGMSGFEVGDILALQNGWKMPYAVNLTCHTGSFAGGTSRSEAWIRAGIPPDVPTGGIASVGTATGGTHTRYNNCITYGVWYGVFWERLYRFGESLTRGKFELFVNYGVQDLTRARIFSHWNNLMGDAAGELWTGVPQPLDVAHPDHVANGANALAVDVSAGGSPCDGAYVCLWKDGELHTGGLTGSDGTVELALPPLADGELKLTVTKHNCRPYLTSLPVGVVEEVFVACDAHTLDDDAQGTSAGNGDGGANPGEALELPVRARNFGTSGAPAVTGHLTCTDPYVSLNDAVEDFGDIAAGDTAWSADDFDLAIDGGAPNGHILRLDLDLNAGDDTWRSLIEIPVVAAELEFEAATLHGCGERLDPGESGELSVRLRNVGDAPGEELRATLQSQSPWVVVTDAEGTFGTLPVDGSAENAGDRFGLSVSPQCFPGHVASFLLLCEFSGAARDTVALALSVGVASSDDPTGPDRYGYYAFDNTDASYPEAPSYAWVEIDPRYGGPGTSVGLTDFGDAQDDSRTLALPFPFTYYGVTYHEATICSNGWIAMGDTYLTNYRNWNIPGAGAPPNMIAPMWDDLYQAGGDLVYHWYDAALGRYVVQWSRLRNAAGGAGENFEAIFYDATVHPTATGDGLILFQYQIFNNTDSEQHYSTTGIQNATNDDGVMYGYYNYYNAGAAPIASGRAIRFIALSDSARGLLQGTVRNASNGGAPLAGAEVRVLEANLAFTSAGDGTYGGSVPAGVYTLVSAHASFAPDTAWSVTIDPGGLTERDFALTDVAGPTFLGTTQLPSTSDTVGPYEVSTRVRDDSPVVEATLRYRAGASGWTALPLQSAGGDVIAAAIPGQPLGTFVRYYVQARDAAGNTGTDPVTAPSETYWFWVHEPQFADDMEDGEGSWTHFAVTGGYLDQWHRSSSRNHTPSGSWSWKCGSRTGGGYARFVDAALVTEPFELDGVATLRFWHWMDSETFWHGNEYAFDGGRLEVSVDGGAWTPIMPEGGYPYRLMDWQGGSPFPPGIWLYSGTHGWRQAEFVLREISGTVRVRFRFGTDNFELESHEGWYIDDVEIVLPGSAPSAARELTLHPAEMSLRGAVPNPVASGASGPTNTRIRFELPREAFVRLGIFDVAGRRLRDLLAETRAAGMHEVAWDGCLSGGRRAPGGVYYCVMEAAGGRRTQSIIVVR